MPCVLATGDYSFERGDGLPAEPLFDGFPPPVPDLLGLGDPDSDVDGVFDGVPRPDSDLLGLGDPDSDVDGDLLADGEPDWGDGELDGGGDPPCGGGLAVLGTGGGGDCGRWLWKIKIAINTANAASSKTRNQDTKMVFHPARSYRPGQGNGQSRARPGLTLSIQ